jgi:hypothetical protein
MTDTAQERTALLAALCRRIDQLLKRVQAKDSATEEELTDLEALGLLLDVLEPAA